MYYERSGGGITLSGGTPGEQLTFEDPLILESLQNILTELVNSDWIANISEINMERIYDISFTYADRFTVVLGDASELEYKLAVFDVVLARLQESLSESEQEGIIDLSSPEMARFQPYSTWAAENLIELPRITMTIRLKIL